MFFTINCICNIEKYEMICFAKNQQMGFSIIFVIIGIHPLLRSNNYIQRGKLNEFLEAIINWFHGPLRTILSLGGGEALIIQIP